MNQIDSRNIERYQDGEVDSDELFDELEQELEDTGLQQKYREQRIDQLSHEIQSLKHAEVSGVVSVTREADLIAIMSQNFNSNVVVFFYRENFQTCLQMDLILEMLAERHYTSVKYYKIDVLSCPFLVTKLKIKVLPCVLVYQNGVERDRLVGFEKLGIYEDTSSAKDLILKNFESRLYHCGVINRTLTKLRVAVKKPDYDDDDDDDELDI
ncbi:unnamed protein product [Kuraishia capsulata CBS 1993]|uniref:Thioredoxin domain-containing protein n=1 Tax=Kuraishia capsulata CBS 1993 TaxID=1382522 RepID=W6MFK1_9ASCO|nr:uncharacterized protein KUCA_T00000570001 [Kuraishia capsulata CBS 1993]CDK24604.1 unnamed protein product [Kuraishia capsulata CBS 1993]